MSPEFPLILDFYDRELVEKISEKYGLSHEQSLRKFIFSETYRMLSNERLEMWDFSPIGIFDMWECEQITGDPRNSIYIRGE